MSQDPSDKYSVTHQRMLMCFAIAIETVRTWTCQIESWTYSIAVWRDAMSNGCVHTSTWSCPMPDRTEPRMRKSLFPE